MRKNVLALLLTASMLIIVFVALIASQAQTASQDTSMDHPLNRQPKNETSSAVTVEVSRYPLKLAMTVGKTELNLGESLHINFTLENIGDQDLTMFFSDGSEHFWFVIYNESESKSVYTLEIGYALFHDPVVMRPNTTRSQDWDWDQVGDLIYLGLFHDPPCYYKTIASGEYHIVGLFESSTLDRLLIETPPVSFTIHG